MSTEVKNKTKLQYILIKHQEQCVFRVGLLQRSAVLGAYPGRSSMVVQPALTMAVTMAPSVVDMASWGSCRERRNHQPFGVISHRDRKVAAKSRQGHCWVIHSYSHSFIQYMVIEHCHSMWHCASECTQQMSTTAWLCRKLKKVKEITTQWFPKQLFS